MRTGTATASRSRWLVLARMAWLVVAAVAVGLFVAGIPTYFRQLKTVDACTVCGMQLLTQDKLRELQAFGVSPSAYAAYLIGVETLSVALYSATAALIFWLKPRQPLALFGSFMLLTWGVGWSNSPGALASAHPAWRLPADSIGYIGSSAFLTFFYLFPSGRFVPRWTRWYLAVWSVLTFLELFFPAWSLSPRNWPQPLGLVPWLVLFGTVFWAQIYRYRRVSTLIERQQTKWVVFGVIAGALGLIITLSIGSLPSSSGLPGVLEALIGITTIYVSIASIPLSIGIAILRSRLWDIDVIIRRTLIYSLLSATLALLYVGSIVVFGALVRPFAGENNELVIVASTLAIAALFQPLRRRIQAVIDRRFYRRKYDASKTLQAFSVRLRDEVDLGRLSEELQDVVEETMQPAHISLWLRDVPRRSRTEGEA